MTEYGRFTLASYFSEKKKPGIFIYVTLEILRHLNVVQNKTPIQPLEI